MQTDPEPDQKLGKGQKLRNPTEFRRAYDGRNSQVCRWATVHVVRNGLPYCRLGVSVSRRFGNAVKRNRFKRLCREAFRLSKPLLPKGVDIVVNPRQTPTLSEALDSFPRIVRRLNERLGKSSNQESVESFEAPKA